MVWSGGEALWAKTLLCSPDDLSLSLEPMLGGETWLLSDPHTSILAPKYYPAIGEVTFAYMDLAYGEQPPFLLNDEQLSVSVGQ